MRRLGYEQYGVPGGDIGAAVSPQVGRVDPEQIQSTRPQALAYGLVDSPVGQLAWIMDKVREWTYPQGADPDRLIDREVLLAVPGADRGPGVPSTTLRSAGTPKRHTPSSAGPR